MSLNPFRISHSESLYDSGEIVYIHNGKETSSCAYELNEKSKLKIKLPRSLGAVGVKINIFDESSTTLIMSLDAAWVGFVSKYDIYTALLPINKLNVGLYFFSIEISMISGIAYAVKHSSAITFTDTKIKPEFQLSVSDFKYKAPTDKYGGIIYHIFVDRFNRGKKQKTADGAVFVKDWNAPLPEYPKYPGAPLKNNYFYGGTLYGIADKLDYIKSLGVTMIYLSPIFESVSNHKYDTADYMTVDSAFGGDKALAHLIKKAKKFGISIILDGVFNHTGADSIYFNKNGRYETLGAYQSKDSEYFSWFDFEEFPNKYTSWWGIEILPRINPDIPECRNYFVGDGSVIEKYGKMGIAGFRLDVVDELSDDFTEAIKQKLYETNENTVLYGEVWEDASNKIAYGKRKQYYIGKELDGVMNYPLRRGLISYLRDKNTDELRYALTDVMFNAPKRIRDMQMNLIGTHDTERIITVLGGESSNGKSNDYLYSHSMTDEEYKKGRNALVQAYTVLATLPGIPAIFYGDEVGLEGYGDPFNRRTFPWGKEDKELLCHYRKLGEIRRSCDLYKDGDFRLLHLDDNLLAFARYKNSEAYITIINNSKNELSITFSKRVLSLLDMKKSTVFNIQADSSLIVKTKKKTILNF